MSQLPEIPASAYTREMETFGALPDISTFDGEPVSVSRNPLTPGTRPLQLLLLLGTEFPVRYEMSRMCGFRSESHHAGRSCVARLFFMNSCVTQLFFCVTQLCDAAREMRDATREMRGAALWLRDASVLGATYLEQLRGAAVEWHGAGAEMRYVAVLLIAQLGYQEICQRFGFARSYIGRLYSDVHERELENGRLRRHQSHQSSAVSRLQAEVERLRTRLEAVLLIDQCRFAWSPTQVDPTTSDGGYYFG
ncbi:hypothetical protein JCGZ_20261 [Jatropha curcas]|uniref:Uncharacterized protein n=1 Tax=Jatropha curcas TaxID=180498 RepID=A0A067JTX8_JATCU|nr:hypothetical protein JCGZ_20261 [Jatropha curcas]